MMPFIKPEYEEQEAVYTNKHQGTLKLFVNGILVSVGGFNSLTERRVIMKQWTRAFGYSKSRVDVCIEVSHREVRHKLKPKAV